MNEKIKNDILGYKILNNSIVEVGLPICIEGGININSVKGSNKIIKDINASNKVELLSNTEKDSSLLWGVAVTDELNTNGYVIDLEGIDWNTRWKKHPIMSNNHNIISRNLVNVNDITLGLGKKIIRENINGVDSMVIGFDIETVTENGRAIKEKWNQGYVRGLSITIIPTIVEEKNDVMTITECIVVEVAIVAYPSYVNAKKLYTEDAEINTNSVKTIEDKIEVEEKENKEQKNTKLEKTLKDMIKLLQK